MKTKTGIAAFVVTVACAAAMAPPGFAAAKVHPSMAIEWNQTMLNSFATANVAPAAANRLAGVIAAATFDAVNGIERRYTAIHVQPAGDPEASPEAAAATATYTALLAAFPAQKLALDAALAPSVASLPDDDASAQSIPLRQAAGAVGPRRGYPRHAPPPEPHENRAPACARQHLAGGRDHRRVRGQELLQLLASGDRDRGHRSLVAASNGHAVLSGISVGARRRQLGGRHYPGLVLR